MVATMVVRGGDVGRQVIGIWEVVAGGVSDDVVSVCGVRWGRTFSVHLRAAWLVNWTVGGGWCWRGAA